MAKNYEKWISSAGRHPSPWRVRTHEKDGYDWGYIFDATGRAAVAKVIGYIPEEEAAKHRKEETDPWIEEARLIAAAPELLDACISMDSELKQCAAIPLNLKDAWKKMRGAIFKARGETK